MSLTISLNDGSQVPWLGFGTGTALFGQDAATFVKAAIETGITHLDGAQAYRNEETLGKGIKDSGVKREKLFITTKLAETPAGPIKSTLKTSLKDLGVDQVDLFLIHSPFLARKEEGKLKQWWKEMEEIKKEGLAKSIGVSNFKVEDLQVILEDATIIPSVNQIEMHPYIWDTASVVYDFCKEKGIVVQSYGGLSPITVYSGGSVDPILASAAERLSKESGTTVSPGQVLTKWLIQKGVIIITTSSKVSRIKESLAVPSLPDLTSDEISAIETEGLKVHKRYRMRHVFDE
ncbi:NADP-dependent oxidoreductase domain-containing protein [Rhodocollybia butyracea]|uniref:NADP-dependent oxidoreductase domain-containing protein n=1 Tax=Rhodocollybia butyracea TaxID=206335 RepID=A0A9P5PDL0_9AGAR|nr:NADP-dependent oxidoreductase domain-containing protein [Rhodocollybia butyracea]